MNIANKTVLITGANRGIGRALVEETLRRGAKKIYAGARSALQHPDKRVTPLTLDVTDAEQIRELPMRSSLSIFSSTTPAYRFSMTSAIVVCLNSNSPSTSSARMT